MKREARRNFRRASICVVGVSTWVLAVLHGDAAEDRARGPVRELCDVRPVGRIGESIGIAPDGMAMRTTEYSGLVTTLARVCRYRNGERERRDQRQ